MRTLLLTALLLTSAVSAAPDEEELARRAKYQDAGSQKISAAYDEADTLSSQAIFEEMQRLLAVGRASAKARGGFPDMKDWERTYGFGQVLEKRKKQGDVSGTFYWAANQWESCRSLDAMNDPQTELRRTCWEDTMNAFKSISNVAVGATANIAKMYQFGFGVPASKYAAADWYAKAGEQSAKSGLRDDALTNMEAALALVPDHPSALRLRKALLQ